MENTNPHKYGRKIKQYRQKKNLTTKEFAKSSGLSRGYINSIERGAKNDLKISTLLRITAVLNVTLDDILSYDLDIFNRTNNNDANLVSGFYSLPIEKKEYIIGLMLSYMKLRKNTKSISDQAQHASSIYTSQIDLIMKDLSAEEQRKIYDMIVKVREFKGD